MLWWSYGRKKYMENFKKFATADCKLLFPKFSDNLKCMPEMQQEWKRENGVIYQNYPEFMNYKGAKILIIGGGNSTNNMDWDKLEAYDYVWSVNHFFLHPVLKNKKIDLVMLMAEPKLDDSEWLKYRDKFQPIVGFEVNKKWTAYKFDDYKKYFCMHTYDYTILGACVRMIEFACFLGVSHLDFTGLDGVEAILEGKHAFQPGKTELPGVLKARAAYSSPSSLKNDSVYVFQASYTVFWERIRKQFPHIIFKNLGGGEHYHEIIMRSNPV